MFLGGNASFARVVGRLINLFGGPPAAATAVTACDLSKDKASARVSFDMAKLAQASSAFVKVERKVQSYFDMSKMAQSSKDRSPLDMSKMAQSGGAFAKKTDDNKQTFDMAKLALSSSDFYMGCSKDCLNCGCEGRSAPLEPLDQDVTTASNDNNNGIALSPSKADPSNELPAVGIVVAMAPEPVIKRDGGRELAARLRVVATMNGPKALRARRANTISTRVRPAPKRLSAVVRKTSSTGLVTWPAYKGRSAAQSRLNSGTVSVSAQVAALRETVNTGKRRTTPSDSRRALERAA